MFGKRSRDHAHACDGCGALAVTFRTERREVPWGTRRYLIDDEYWKCGNCGEAYYDTTLADQRQRRVMQAAIRAAGNPEDDHVRPV